MKYFLPLLILLINHNVFSQRGSVVVRVEGVRQDKGGEIYAALFTEDHFPVTGKHILGAEACGNSPTVRLAFSAVPAGWYGIAVFQDVDGNKQLSTNLIGYPREPFGFSNDARPKLGPPSFSEARFWVDKDRETTVTIRLR